jgi:hypothetical protein
MGAELNSFIPPVAALILEKAKAPETIPEAALEIRRKFRPIRRMFREIQFAITGTRKDFADACSRVAEFRNLLGATTTRHQEILAAQVIGNTAEVIV